MRLKSIAEINQREVDFRHSVISLCDRFHHKLYSYESKTSILFRVQPKGWRGKIDVHRTIGQLAPLRVGTRCPGRRLRRSAVKYLRTAGAGAGRIGRQRVLQTDALTPVQGIPA